MYILQFKFGLFSIVSIMVEPTAVIQSCVGFQPQFNNICFSKAIDLQPIGWLFLISEFYLELFHLSEPE